MPDNVVQFPGQTTQDIDPDEVLTAAQGKLENVLILGETPEGDFYMASSTSDMPLYMLYCERLRYEIMRLWAGPAD